MANEFKNSTLRASGTSLAAVTSAVGGSTEVTVIGMTVANIVAAAIKVSVQLVDGSANATWLCKDSDVAEGGTLVVIGGDQKLVMTTGDLLKVKSDTASSLDVIVSYLEIT